MAERLLQPESPPPSAENENAGGSFQTSNATCAGSAESIKNVNNMKNIVIAPRHREEDIRNLFGPGTFHLKIYRNSIILWMVYAILLQLLKFSGGISDIKIWAVDPPKTSNSFLFRFIKDKINVLSMNAEFDAVEYQSKDKYYVLFENRSYRQLKFQQGRHHSDLFKLKRNGIFYFGELDITPVDNHLDKTMAELSKIYFNSLDFSDEILDADCELFKLFNMREIGNYTQYANLMYLRNLQRYFYLRYIQKIYPSKTLFIGTSIIHSGLKAMPDIRNKELLKNHIRSVRVNLDLGSKSFHEIYYPRSVMILSLNATSLVQLRQDYSRATELPAFSFDGQELISGIAVRLES